MIQNLALGPQNKHHHKHLNISKWKHTAETNKGPHFDGSICAKNEHKRLRLLWLWAKSTAIMEMQLHDHRQNDSVGFDYGVQGVPESH